ncbi:MAG: addiction module antidote protein [Pseudomonadota bacterium]
MKNKTTRKTKIKKISDHNNFDDWATAIIGSSKKQTDDFLKLALKQFEEDGDIALLLLALRQIAKAKGGFSQVAEKTGLTREALYKILSKTGNPTITTFKSILEALGYCLSIKVPKYA